MIYDEMEDCPNPADERAEAWEFWHERANKFETEKVRLEATVTTWRQVFESIEAHLMDRVNMRDPANPDAYLSIIRSEVANINRSSDAIVNARWADHARANAEIERLRTALENVRRDLYGILPQSLAGSVYKRRTEDVIKRIEAALNIQQRASE